MPTLKSAPRPDHGGRTDLTLGKAALDSLTVCLGTILSQL